LYDSFSKQGFGLWLKKPLKQDDFTVFSDKTIVESISSVSSPEATPVVSLPVVKIVEKIREIVASPIVTASSKDFESDDDVIIIDDKQPIVIDLTDSDDENDSVPIASMETDMKVENLSLLDSAKARLNKKVDDTAATKQMNNMISSEVDASDESILHNNTVALDSVTFENMKDSENIVTLEPPIISNQLLAMISNDNVTKLFESKIANCTKADLPVISVLKSAIITHKANSLSEPDKNVIESCEIVQNRTQDKISNMFNAKVDEENNTQSGKIHDEDVEIDAEELTIPIKLAG
jgi:hypothetical protein